MGEAGRFLYAMVRKIRLKGKICSEVVLKRNYIE
jgi:hypothetical protein